MTVAVWATTKACFPKNVFFNRLHFQIIFCQCSRGRRRVDCLLRLNLFSFDPERRRGYQSPFCPLSRTLVLLLLIKFSCNRWAPQDGFSPPPPPSPPPTHCPWHFPLRSPTWRHRQGYVRKWRVAVSYTSFILCRGENKIRPVALTWYPVSHHQSPKVAINSSLKSIIILLAPTILSFLSSFLNSPLPL